MQEAHGAWGEAGQEEDKRLSQTHVRKQQAEGQAEAGIWRPREVLQACRVQEAHPEAGFAAEVRYLREIPHQEGLQD